MKFQLKRLIVALILSGSCFLATFLWSKSQMRVSSKDGSDWLAQVAETEEDTRKKFASSLQWLPLEKGDYLFDGDTVRTSDMSEVTILFNDDRKIRVDSNSTFVIQKSNDEIALDLKEGSVFVDAKSLADTKDTKSLVIVADNKKVDLTGAKAQISKGKDKTTQLNILEGKMQIRDDKGNVKDLNAGQAATLNQKETKIREEIKIISPRLTKDDDETTLIYYIDPDGDSTVAFRWNGASKADESVLLLGDSKNTMKERAVAPLGREAINLSLTPGNYYWQLITRNPANKQKTHESTLFKLQVQSRFSVMVLAPKNEEVFLYDTTPIVVGLKWQKPAVFKSLVLEVSKSPTMSGEFIINNRNVSNAQDFNLNVSTPGDYFWRIATKYEDMERPIYTKIQKFRVVKKEPPKPPPTLTWLTTQEKQFFVEKPVIKLAWDALTRKEEIAKWKLEITNTQDKNILSRELTDLSFTNDQIAIGSYKVTIEPFDKNGLSMGKTAPKTIDIAELPLPRAPVINSQNVKRNQNTNRYYFENGIINLQWDYQPVAKSYEVEIYSPTTNKTERVASGKNSLQYSGATMGLSPGAYQVKVTPLDQHNRRGPASETFEFEVPSFTTMSAPKLKNLNIKQSGQ